MIKKNVMQNYIHPDQFLEDEDDNEDMNINE